MATALASRKNRPPVMPDGTPPIGLSRRPVYFSTPFSMTHHGNDNALSGLCS